MVSRYVPAKSAPPTLRGMGWGEGVIRTLGKGFARPETIGMAAWYTRPRSGGLSLTVMAILDTLDHESHDRFPHPRPLSRKRARGDL